MQQTDRNEKTGDQKMEKAMQKYLDKQIDRAEFAKEVQDYWTNLSE